MSEGTMVGKLAAFAMLVGIGLVLLLVAFSPLFDSLPAALRAAIGAYGAATATVSFAALARLALARR